MSNINIKKAAGNCVADNHSTRAAKDGKAQDRTPGTIRCNLRKQGRSGDPGSILDWMIQGAEGFANFAMRKFGHMPPIVFVATPEGGLRYLPPSMEDAQAKEDFANTIRLICAAYQATAVVMASSGWMNKAQPGETIRTASLPSEAHDRREVVILMGEAKGSAVKQKILPIIRTDAGGFFGFGETIEPDGSGIQGRFTPLLLPKALDAAEQMQAKKLLERMGVTSANLLRS